MKRLAALQDWPVLSSRASAAAVDRLVEVVGAEQDERVRAAELEHDLLQVAAGDLGDGGAGALGAGDRDAVHARVGDHPLDLLVGRVDVLVGALGEAGVVEDLLHRLGRFRALRRVLEQDRVADHQVRAGEAGHLVVGEVPGHDPEQDAEGAAADERRALAAEQLDRLVGHQAPRRCRRRSRRSSPAKSTSPSACSIGLPISRTMISASSWRRSVWSSPTLRTSAARSATVEELGQLREASSAAVDRGAELVVGDLRVLLDRLAGGWVDYRVGAHLSSPLSWSIVKRRFKSERLLDRHVLHPRLPRRPPGG